jgi:hypothetical protein
LSSRLVALLAVLVSCAAAATRPADLRAHVEFLASDILQGRDTPSAGLDIAAQYIAVQFHRAGLTPGVHGGWFQEKAPGERNVVGLLPGITGEYVIVSAHYDHVGICKPGEQDPICNGANDDASGVASMIEIAARLAKRAKLRRNVVFIAFFGEEKDLSGSVFYAENPVFDLNKTVAQINLEHTGRTDDLEGPNPRTLEVTGFDYCEVGAILAAAAPPGVKFSKRPKWSDEAFVRSDNEPLARKGVPAHTLGAAFMFPDYHQPGDEWQKLDYTNMAVITDAAAAGIAALANRPTAPKWYIGAPYGGDISTRLAAPPKASARASGNSRATRPPTQRARSRAR